MKKIAENFWRNIEENISGVKIIPFHDDPEDKLKQTMAKVKKASGIINK